MFVIKNKIIFFIFSGLLVAAAIVGFIVKGFQFDIDFTGGSVLEVTYGSVSTDTDSLEEDTPSDLESTSDISTIVSVRPDIEVLQSAFAKLGLPGRLQPFGDTGVIVRTKDLSDAERQTLLTALAVDGVTPTVERFNSVGPSIGKELRKKAFIALIVVMLAIIVYLAYAFRTQTVEGKKKQVGPSGWLFGLIAVVTLIHDVIIPAGVFAWFGLSVDSLFVVGLLSILGLSVNDTIVVFDRIRENLQFNKEKNTEESFPQTVGRSIKQTIARSINTSMTIIVVLVVLFVAGPETTQNLALIMLIGMIAGTYSSICLASPLLVLFNKKEDK